jgi:hypothetical protein
MERDAGLGYVQRLDDPALGDGTRKRLSIALWNGWHGESAQRLSVALDHVAGQAVRRSEGEIMPNEFK